MELRRVSLLAAWLAALASAGPLRAEPAKSAAPLAAVPLKWHTDYSAATRQAVAERRQLLIVFQAEGPDAVRESYERTVLGNPSVAQYLPGYVLAKLPLAAKVQPAEAPILTHPAFAEMLGRQGVAIVDYQHVDQDYYQRVVSAFPFNPGLHYVVSATQAMLTLPPGTITQRTMIFAVRIHPEAPASTQGQFNSVLAREARSHSDYQADIRVQGHHSWDSRFQRISSQMPAGLTPQEVVAESWPNENLVEACVDCVHSWRQSPGHWGAVRDRHSLFGYDIKRGRNGIWYATGIFGRR